MSGDIIRVVARPGRVVLQRPEGEHGIAVDLVTMTPGEARRMAGDLEAFAALAEDMLQKGVAHDRAREHEARERNA